MNFSFDSASPFAKLGIRVPIIQAPMAGWATATVSNAGALGSLGIGMMKAEDARAVIRETRLLTDKPFNVNVFCHRHPAADGYIFYQSRADDMIISAGYNISGPEVESALLLHDAVAECGVVSVPDEERGQIAKA